jgi:hypothetical protein
MAVPFDGGSMASRALRFGLTFLAVLSFGVASAGAATIVALGASNEGYRMLAASLASQVAGAIGR